MPKQGVNTQRCKHHPTTNFHRATSAIPVMIAVTQVSANGLEMTQNQIQQKLTNPRLTPVERELLLQQLHHLAQVAKNKHTRSRNNKC